MASFRRRPRPFQVLSPLRVTGRANALTASGQKIKRADADGMRRLLQPWQARAFAYYDLVPEIKYAAQFYSRALSVLRLYAAKRDEGDELVEIDDNSDPAVMALDRIQDPGGGRAGLLANYGRLIFLIGEGLLFVSIDPETDLEQWEMLSPDELQTTSAGYRRIKAPSVQAEVFTVAEDDDYEPVEGDAVAYRLWRRHPRYSMLADSTMQGVLDVAEELVLLTHSVRARARSRLAGSGILLVNGKVSAPPLDSGAADEDPETDPFIANLTEAMTAPIVDEGAASAVVPLVVRTDIDELDNAIKHIQIVDPTQLYPETGLRAEAIRRLAIGLDMPPEALLGLGDVNHWGSWSIDEQSWKAHLQPVAEQLVGDLTSAYFQPALRQAGVVDWMDYVIAYDASKVINHPDRSKDAKDLYAARAIGKASLRDAAGFDDDDAMPEDELHEAIGIAVRDASLAISGVVTAPVAPGPPFGQDEEEADGEASADVEKEAPKEKPDEDGNEEPVVASAFEAARVLGASQLALLRTRELAGSRLKNLAKKDKDVFASLEGVYPRDVPATLGRERARELGAPNERELIAGAEHIFAEALALWAIPAAAASRLISLLTEHAARHLYDEAPASTFPPAFENYVSALGKPE